MAILKTPKREYHDEEDNELDIYCDRRPYNTRPYRKFMDVGKRAMSHREYYRKKKQK